jgi:hypothetical protein
MDVKRCSREHAGGWEKQEAFHARNEGSGREHPADAALQRAENGPSAYHRS